MELETGFEEQFHGRGGPIQTSFSTWRTEVEQDWIVASENLMRGLGKGKGVDMWSGDHLGTFHGLSTIDRREGENEATRSYAATGYLLPNIGRPNLHVLTDALVTKLVVEKDGTVTGARFLYAGEEHTVYTRKEVILAAGVFKSPQILELSGIGNPIVLENAGVEYIVQNMCVGENFQDHVTTAVGYEVVDGVTTLDIL